MTQMVATKRRGQHSGSTRRSQQQAFSLLEVSGWGGGERSTRETGAALDIPEFVGRTDEGFGHLVDGSATSKASDDLCWDFFHPFVGFSTAIGCRQVSASVFGPPHARRPFGTKQGTGGESMEVMAVREGRGGSCSEDANSIGEKGKFRGKGTEGKGRKSRTRALPLWANLVGSKCSSSSSQAPLSFCSIL